MHEHPKLIKINNNNNNIYELIKIIVQIMIH